MISIIIRTSNDGWVLNDTLCAIRNQCTKFFFEVVIVDSNSTDETINIAKMHNCKVVSIVPSMFTYGRALNWGISACSGQVIVSLSSHCIPHNNWLNNLVLPIIFGNADLTYGSQVADSKSRCSEYNYFNYRFNISNNFLNNYERFNNANSAFMKSDWIVNNFREDVIAQEDIYFARTNIHLGKVIKFVSDARVTHIHNYTNFQLYNRLRLEIIENNKLGIVTPAEFHGYYNYFATALKQDFNIALKRNVFFRAFVGIVCFRAVELFVYIANKFKKFNSA